MRLVPESPEFVTETEREVWDLLRRTGNPEWTLLSNVNLTDENRDYEADLVVLMPEVGVLVLEVKGGSVWVDSDGSWKQGAGANAHAIDPVGQAMKVKHALWAYVKADPRWGRRSRVRFGHSVVVPRTPLSPDFSTPDCPRSIIHGRQDITELAGRLWDIAAMQESGHRKPTQDDCDRIVEILAGRSLPQRYLLADAEEREARADRLTQEQATLLKVTRLIHRTEVRGGAGSGKTVLALTQAKELTRGRGEGQKAKRVALLCYSIGLATWFKRALDGVDRKSRPAFVGTFEEFAAYLGVDEFGTRDDADFWESRLPVRMAELVDSLPDGKRFDTVIVDEAQDFADLWWTPIMRALRDEEAGGLHIYSDENQRVFARFGRPPVTLVPLVLDQNLRNTKQIAETFSPLTPMRMHARGGDGPEVDLVALPDGSTPEQIVDAADDVVDQLLDEQWRPQDVVLLTTGSRHPEQVSQQDMLGQAGYWESFWDTDQVFYGHVLGCKGLERRAVVLAVNDKSIHERAKERLYVGLSRATDKLVVVGVPSVIREMGGPEVAKRLGL